MEGLPVAKPIHKMMADVDQVVENAIRNHTLGDWSPYAGWTLEQFQAQRAKHTSTSRAPVGPKPVKPGSQLRDSASHLEDPR